MVCPKTLSSSLWLELPPSEQSRNMNGEVIKSQARNLQARLVQELHSMLVPTLAFPEGWHSNFKWGWVLKSYCSNGEAFEADQDLIYKELSNLQNFLSVYDAKNTFNANAFCLQNRIASDRTIATQLVLGRKKQKNKLTVLIFCNADGPKKFELNFIGTSQRPRSFKKNYGNEYGLDYHFNSKTWMTSNLHIDWLQRFDAYISLTLNCNVVLLIDNRSFHGSLKTIPPL